MAKIAAQLPVDIFDYIAKNAGVLLKEFDITKKEIVRTNIIGATSGGINFVDTPEFTDYGDDIDNCPKNMLELKEISGRTIEVSGTFVSANPEEIKNMIGAADYENNVIIPRNILKKTDFKKLWFVTDYGDGGLIAVELDNVLSTSGLSIQTANEGKAQFSFTYTAHFSMDDPENIPYKIHIIEGNTSTGTDTPEVGS